jgi:hypothetical protein
LITPKNEHVILRHFLKSVKSRVREKAQDMHVITPVNLHGNSILLQKIADHTMPYTERANERAKTIRPECRADKESSR